MVVTIKAYPRHNGDITQFLTMIPLPGAFNKIVLVAGIAVEQHLPEFWGKTPEKKLWPAHILAMGFKVVGYNTRKRANEKDHVGKPHFCYQFGEKYTKKGQDKRK